jgi:diguanylate cyclase
MNLSSAHNLIAALNIPTSAVLWSVGAVLVGMICGFVLGSSFALYYEPWRLKREKSRLLKCLTQILQSTEQLNADVDTHNDTLASVQQSVTDIHAEGDLNAVQEKLVEEIHAMVHANRRLENDLTITQFELHQRARELDTTRSEARLDKLSGLANRRAFDECFAFFYSSFKSRNEPFGLLLADIDHFKRINDAYGHAAGDVVIQRIGAILRQAVRGDDIVCRLGGDEFAVLLKGNSEVEYEKFASRIRSTVAKMNFEIGDDISLTSITVSVGVAKVMPEDTKESLLERADKALYRSKELGRNLVHVWNGSDAMINVTMPDVTAH